MRERVLSEFDEKENNSIFNVNENQMENNNEKINNTFEDDSQHRESSLSDFDIITYTSTFTEEEKDKSIYVYIHNFKDFLMMLSLLICPSFNFNYLYLPLLIIGFIYIRYILRNTMVYRRRKSHFEAIVFISSLLLLIFKVIIIILAMKENESIKNNSSLYIDLGVSYLINDGIINIIKSFIGESIIIISCICSFIIRKMFAFEDQDLNKKKENDYEENDLNNFFSKMVKYLFLSFFVIVGFVLFNKSILSLCYILFFYFTLIMYSLISKNKVFYIIKGTMLALIICLLFQILLLNISNVHSIAYKYFDPKSDSENKNFIIKNWEKIGFYFAYYDNNDSKLFIDWTGYLFGCLSLVVLSFIYKDISLEHFIEVKTKKKQQKENIAFVKQQNVFVKFCKKFLNYFSGPYFVLHIVRILSITWIYFYTNFYSVGVIIWLFFSFLHLDVIVIRYLAIIILLPIIVVSLISLNGSRIFDSFFNDLDELAKIKYMHFALGNYSDDYTSYIRFIAVNIFFCFIICFISILNKSSNDMDEKKDDDNIKEENELKQHLLYDMENDSIEIRNNIKENQKNELIDNNINIDQTKEEKDRNNKDNNILLEEEIRKEDNNNKLMKSTLSNIIKKNIFVNIDKITLIVMYFVANKTINVIHLIFVIIFMIQLLTPHCIKKLCAFIIILFQLLFLGEYIMDLLKCYFKDTFKNNLSKIQFFLVYNIDDTDESLSKTQIEIFIYGIIYCFYIHYQLYNNEYYQKLTLDKNINMTNNIEDNLANRPLIKNILYFIGNIILEIYIWVIISCFIFFTCFFEINLLFAVKMFIFLLSVYQFCIFIQNHKFGEGKMDLKISHILLIYCGLNTFVVYIYQLFCLFLEVIKSKEYITKSDLFIIKNFPNLGLTIYKDENLYYNLLPHFFTNFLSLLYLWEMKRMSENFNKNKIEEDKKKNKVIVLSNDIENNTKKKKVKKEEINIFDIKNNNIEEKEKEEEEEEENEQEDQKISVFEKYHSNKMEMTFLNVKYFLSMIILSFTKLYWLFLFVTTCIIYTTQDLSAGIFIYIFIFGITFIAMFYSLINNLHTFINKDSYFISKVIRYYLIEKKQHISKNKYFRSISFRFLLGYSLLLLFMFYLYGVFDLFQHGCNEKLFKGCDKSYDPIVSSDDKESDNHDNTEALFESISYLLGFYIDIRKIGIISASWFHLLFSALIAFDVYIQKIENYFTSCTVVNRRRYQILLNENTKLKALISSGNDNFILNLGDFLSGNNNDNNNSFLSSDSSNLSYTLSLSKMSNINDYDELFNIINNNFDRRRLNISAEDENLGKRYIIQFLEAFRKASAKKVSLAEKKNKYKIIKAIKEIFEEIIISLLLCNAITKINIWSFIYIIISIYLISTQKTMMKYYVFFCFLIFAVFTQLIIFISNLTEQTDPTPDVAILKVINSRLNIPWYASSKEMGFFFGLGVTKSQINLIWMDFIEIVVIYIYLDYFSYSIYQNVENKGSSRKGINRINYYNLHLDKRVNNCVRNMSERQFTKIKECMKYNLDIDIGSFDDFRNKILLDTNVQIIRNNLDTIKEEKGTRTQSLNTIEIDNQNDRESFPHTPNTNNIINTDSKSAKTKKNSLLKLVTVKNKEFLPVIQKTIWSVSTAARGLKRAIYYWIAITH